MIKTISLKSTKVENFSFDDLSDPAKKGDMQLGFSPLFNKDEINNFFVEFDFTLIVSDKTISNKFKGIDCKFIAEFFVEEGIDDEFMKSHFPAVNAPAIAYPFLRAFISTFLVNAGYDVAVLPSINFVEIYKRNHDNQDNKIIL